MCEIMEKIAAEERAQGKQDGILEILYSLVKDQIITLADAARRAQMNEEEFLANLNKAPII